MNKYDVIVVGGGPAGAAAAVFCVQHGLSVALLEHARFPRHKVCGDVINPNCWPVLERLGAAEKIRALSQHAVNGAWFTTCDGRSMDVPLRAVAIRRGLLDITLLDHARDSGVKVIENETVHDITPGREVLTRTRGYLSLTGIIGADGRHSVVASKCDLADGRGRNGHIAVQGHFRAPAALDDRVQLHLFRGGYCGVVRVDAERANLCVVTDERGAKFHGDCEALFARTVWQNPFFRELGVAPEPLEPLRSAAPLWRGMNAPCRNGVFLVGDALRVVEPFTGQGIFFALRTAELAAEAIGGGRDYETAARGLYRQRARTNGLLRRLMYHERAAGVAVAALKHLPSARGWLAANVLAV